MPDPAPRPARVEFIPTDAEMVPAALPRVNSFEQWLMRNMRPLLFIALALTVEGLATAVQLSMLRPPRSHETVTEVEKTAPAGDEAILQRFESSPVAWLHLGIVAMGFLASVGLGIGYIASADEQRWIRSLVSDFPPRPQPALRALDLLACLFVFMAVANMIGTIIVFFAGDDLGSSLRMVLNLDIVAVTAAITIAVAVHLARQRGGGAHGSFGIWPFWKLSPLSPRRSIIQDVGLGVATYILTAWMLIVTLQINAKIVEYFGEKPDQHELVRVIGEGDQPAWALVAISISATVGAAFFEEIFFRGILYNVLRRHLGGAIAALGAAFLFSIAHGIHSQILGLWFLGLVMTWLYDRTGRLVASMTFHFTNNLVALLSMLLSQGS